MRMIRWIVVVVVGLGLGIAALTFGARFADGPIALFPGGPFQSGEWVEEVEIDWSFAADIGEIELQSGEPPTSRTTWILVDDGEAYVPCSIDLPPGKRWHKEALTRPEAVVRIEGKRYRRILIRVDDEALHERLFEISRTKYNPPANDASRVWHFHLAPPE